MKGLDKWLTTEPEDRYSDYSEWVLGNGISDWFYNNYESFCESDECDKLVERLFDKGTEPLLAGKIIERYFNLYINK
jgi:hypothetical protein